MTYQQMNAIEFMLVVIATFSLVIMAIEPAKKLYEKHWVNWRYVRHEAKKERQKMKEQK